MLFLWSVAFFAVAAGLSAWPLPSETHDGIIYIPSLEAVHSPSALETEAPPPERLDYALYTEFQDVYTPGPPAGGGEESAIDARSTENDQAGARPPAEAEPRSAEGDARESASTTPAEGGYVNRAVLQAEGLGEYTSIYTYNNNDGRNTTPDFGPLEVGRIHRNETVPFALLDSDNDRYEAVLWSAELSYANLVVHAGGNTMVLDLGALYEYNLAPEGGNAASGDAGRADAPPFATDTPSFLPAAPLEAELEWFEPLDEFLITVTARTYISMDNPSLEPAEVRMFLRPAADTLELAGYFIEELDYANGSRYSARHELLEGNPAALREQVLRRTHLGGSSYRYRLAVGEYQVSRGRFVRTSRARTVFEERFPHTLRVAAERSRIYPEPGGGGESVTELSRGTRVRAVEPWDRLDTRDGVDGLWFRVRTAGHEGWMWAPDLAEPE